MLEHENKRKSYCKGLLARTAQSIGRFSGYLVHFDLRATSGLFSYRFNCRQFFEVLLEKVIQECADGSNLFLPLVSGIGKVRLKITFVLND